MAQPTQPIEIWAQSDVVLPVSHQINKVRPIDDLWEKGYDKGQKPANEEWNYLWNMTTLWLSYITGEQIPELDNRYLQRSLNLSDVADKAASRNNLEVYSKTESEDRYVNVAGDTMTGALGVTRLNFTQVASSDNASIFAQTTASDKTFLDFNIGDNAGDAQASGNVVDVMRFRFQPTTGAAVSMMELNSLDGTNAYLRVLGQIWGRQLTIAGNLSWTGSGTGNTLSLSGSLSANSLNIASQSAVVGGRNIVRAINGVTADGNGNLTLTIGNTTFSAGSPGWWRDNSTGMVIQWGYGTWKGRNNETYDTINFPMTFPNACLQVVTGTQYQAESVQVDCWGAVAGFNNQYARLQCQWSGENEWNVNARCTYIAIGF